MQKHLNDINEQISSYTRLKASAEYLLSLESDIQASNRLTMDISYYGVQITELHRQKGCILSGMDNALYAK